MVDDGNKNFLENISHRLSINKDNLESELDISISCSENNSDTNISTALTSDTMVILTKLITIAKTAMELEIVLQNINFLV